MKRRLIFVAIAVLGAVGFVAIADIVHRTAIDAWNRRQLQDLASRTLVRAEVAIDLAVINLGHLLAAGRTDCDEATIAALRRTVFAVGSLEDIHVILPDYRCRAFPDFGIATREHASGTVRHSARNQAFALAPIVDGDWSGLGVIWTFEDDREFFAVMSTDSLVFDMLPQPLREDASVMLVLNDGTPVATYAPSQWETRDPRVSVAFNSESSRYPLAARIVVDEAKLAALHRTVPPKLLAMVLALATVFGLMTARGLVRRPHPAEELDSAIASGDVVPYFQPIVSLSDQRIIGCEMLARWIRPDGTSVAPDHFISLAEVWGRADSLTEALLAQAGRMLGSALAVRPGFKLCFNITPAQFIADGFADRLRALVDAHDLPRDQLVIELTERQEIASVDAAGAVTAELRAAGMRVAIDDTGTGHNGLAVIKTLGAAYLKIDKFFVDGLDMDPRARTLVAMLVQVARDLRMTIVAEGIERPEQVAVLLSLGVREGQGFLFSPPLPVDKFHALLDASGAEGMNRKRTNSAGSRIATADAA